LTNVWNLLAFGCGEYVVAEGDMRKKTILLAEDDDVAMDLLAVGLDGIFFRA
jgi:hypothetical protein